MTVDGHAFAASAPRVRVTAFTYQRLRTNDQVTAFT